MYVLFLAGDTLAMNAGGEAAAAAAGGNPEMRPRLPGFLLGGVRGIGGAPPGGAPNLAAENNNNNVNPRVRNLVGTQQNPLLNVRDRLFHALFYRIALTYARAFPRPVRRVLEFSLLLKVINIMIPSWKAVIKCCWQLCRVKVVGLLTC